MRAQTGAAGNDLYSVMGFDHSYRRNLDIAEKIARLDLVSGAFS
jgi:hypothetical protein